MPIGIVIKATSSFYYVNSHDKIWTCKVRGRMKQSRYSICTGDEVEFAPVGDGRGAIESVLPRRSFLQRPEVANVSQVLLTFAAKSPDVDADLIDKFLILT